MMIIKKSILLIVLIACTTSMALAATQEGKPNILWIFVEDASCHISCYGEQAITTPNIDALATDGIRFENAFVTAPVCSPSRSALVTGMFQTTLGAHNHRSQVKTGKGGGNSDYFDSYELPEAVTIASKFFEEAGYFTSNETIKGKPGKQDYNFEEENIYMGDSWKDAPKGVPFFAQIQLKGGKNRNRKAATNNFDLPPYYYDDEVMREDWKDYLGSWQDTDQDVAQIVADLKSAGVYENTLIFFLTDHGISHLRGKQFLYDEGIKVPLIVRFPDGFSSGTTREDLVMQIDLLPSSLAYAGIPIPENIQGKNIFANDYQERDFIYAARDRCDETTEIIRTVRTKKFKYIRNFLNYRPHAQRNQYKDGKEISRHMKQLYQEGKLNELQSSFYQSSRPVEELYDLEKDPFEINNLAGQPAHQQQLKEMRSTLYAWMDQINDPGLIPEPWLEELGKKYGNKYQAMQQPEYQNINRQLIEIIEAGEKGQVAYLLKKAESPLPSERYWAVTWLGVNKSKKAIQEVKRLLADQNPSVRIAANLALYKINPEFDPVEGLERELDNENLIVGMYALNALEQTGIRNRRVHEIAKKGMENDYEFTKRFAKFLAAESEKEVAVKNR